jgi:hypothetical protein
VGSYDYRLGVAAPTDAQEEFDSLLRQLLAALV